ncbi:hypothetical protein E2C06_34905, partial [Dankookia rubra]
MRLASTDPAAFPAPGPALGTRLRRWLRRRRQAAVLRVVEPRLREDAGLPVGPAMASLAPARPQAA